MKKINILALGSSITKGYGNFNVSYVEMLNEYNDETVKFEVYKEAVNGTCLANRKADSYLARVKKIDLNILKTFNYALIQLSTNDLHLFNNKYDLDNERTTFGAIVNIIEYLRKNSEAKIVFYTCFTKINNKYESIIEKLKSLAAIYHFDVIDFYNDANMRSAIFKKIMSDGIHPNKEGYILMTKELIEYFKSNSKD